MQAADVLERAVRTIMEPDVFWVPVDMPLERAAEALTERRISGAVACTREGKVVGVITKTDLTESYAAGRSARVVADVMTSELLAVAPDDPVERAVQVMVFERVHRLLVVDSAGALAGVVTSMDILRELVGLPRPLRHAIDVASH